MPHKYHNYLCLLAIVAALSWPLVPPAHAATSVSLTWNSPPDPDVSGYNVFYGTSSGNYTNSVNVGNSTTATLSPLMKGATYFVVVTSYNAASLQSLPSNEISFTVPDNIPPAVTLTNPQSGASFSASSPISVAATASDADGSITKVEFYAGTSLVGQDTNSPYAATWSNPAAGNYLLTALAYDDSGTAVRSSGVAITVQGATVAATPTPAPTSNKRIHVFAQKKKVRGGARAVFKIIATPKDSSQPTVVNYSLGGTVNPGVDYTQSGLSGQAVIPAGSRTTMVAVNTIRIPGPKTRKQLMISLLPDGSYNLGQSTAVVTIVNH